MAGNPPIRTVGEELGLLDPTPIEGKGASGVKTAARWRRQQIGDDSRNRGERGSRLELRALRRDGRLEKALRVRMKGGREEIGHGSVLDDFPGGHDEQPVAQLR